jgi:phosphonopyruvate decarboxylase
VTGAALAALLEAQGYDFFSGVPCSLISSLIATLETHPRLPYVPAVREDVAVGLAAGAWLAGRRPLVLMQNSGLGTSLNALVSLSLMYRLPALLLVTWRGHGGQDAPEHLLMGEISPGLLEMIRIPHRALSAKTIADDIAWGRAESERLSQPVALLLPPGILETEERGAVAGRGALEERGAAEGEPSEYKNRGRLSGSPSADRTPCISRFEALRAAVSALTVEPVVHANGYICRESFAVKDRIENFYMIGSMGLASAIGLGVALAAPDRPTVVFDGDGNLLMSLGILPMIGGGPVMGRGRPDNLVHVVFDNALYGSTGSQASPSRAIGLHQIARAAGYERATAVTAADELHAAVAAAVAGGGPSFILARVTGEEQPAPRIPYAPEEIRDRFRSCLTR